MDKHDDLRARLLREAGRKEAVPTRAPTMNPTMRFVHSEPLRALLAEAEAALPLPASEAVLPDGGPPCNQHPGAPHGFSRNASHSEDRYVCDCEGWSPEPAADLLVRDVCELDPADPESPDTVTVHVAMLQLIANRYCTPQPSPAAHAGGEAVPVDALREKLQELRDEVSVQQSLMDHYQDWDDANRLFDQLTALLSGGAAREE